MTMVAAALKQIRQTVCDIPNLNDVCYAPNAMPRAVISLEEHDDSDGERKAVMFKKRTGLSKAVTGVSRKSQKLRADDEMDENDNGNVDQENVFVKRKIGSRHSIKKFVSTKTGKSLTIDKQTDDDRSKRGLIEGFKSDGGTVGDLQAGGDIQTRESSRRREDPQAPESSQAAELQAVEPSQAPGSSQAPEYISQASVHSPAPEYISLALDDSDDQQSDNQLDKQSEPRYIQSLDLDEGLGFEDEKLALDENEQDLQNAINRRNMKSAIEAYSSGEEDEESGYQMSQLSMKTTKELPSLEKIMTKISLQLEKLRSENNSLVEQIEQIENEQRNIENRQNEVIKSFEKASEEFEKHSESLEKRVIVGNKEA